MAFRWSGYETIEEAQTAARSSAASIAEAANAAYQAGVSARDNPLRGDRIRRRRRRPSTILGDVMAQPGIAIQTLLGA